jgi:hypothetical protein
LIRVPFLFANTRVYDVPCVGVRDHLPFRCLPLVSIDLLSISIKNIAVMTIRSMILALGLLAVSSWIISDASAFVVDISRMMAPSRHTITKPIAKWNPPCIAAAAPAAATARATTVKTETLSSTQLNEQRNKELFELSQDGSGRGKVLLAAVFAACVWLFSIPPEFRRAFICPTDACTSNRAACNQCVTTDEWTTGIKDYYRNGGGVRFDFSIDPRTLEKNKEFISGGLIGKQ